MKQFLLIVLIICCFLPLRAFAQIFDTYSISAIGNRSNIVTEEIDDFRNYKNSFGLSLHIQKSISDRLGILSGVEVSNLRYELEVNQNVTGPNGMPTGETFGDKTTSSLFILSVPVSMKINGPANFFGYIGPRFDFELGSKNGVLEYEVEGMQIKEEDILSEFSEFFVAGWSIGLGKYFNIGDINPSITFRFSGDFSKLVRDEGFIDMQKRRFEILVGMPLFK